MSSDEVDPDGSLDIRPLTVLERSLLGSIWQPIRMPVTTPPSWPIWDYVARTYYEKHPGGPPAEQVLAGLPQSPAQGNYGAYGLYWIDSFPPPGGPNPDQEIGLTIVGLYAISQPDTPLRLIANEFAAIVGSVAKQTAALPADPTKVAREYLPFTPLANWLSHPYTEKPTIVPERVAAKVLQREFARIPMRSSGGNLDGDIDVELSGPWLRPFLNVSTADDYARIVWPERSEAESPVPEPTPLTLVQTIDYFSYVLESTDVWREHRRDKGHHLVRVRSLNSATQLGLPAASRDEFNARVGAFWIIVDHFDVPIIDPEVYQQRYKSKGTLNALQLMLERVVVGGEARDRLELDRALRKIRDVRDLRTEADHDSSEARASAIASRRRLGLPEVVWDWTEAWDVARLQLAAAFDALVRVLQSSERD